LFLSIMGQKNKNSRRKDSHEKTGVELTGEAIWE
jgi:hypothetical protein